MRSASSLKASITYGMRETLAASSVRATRSLRDTVSKRKNGRLFESPYVAEDDSSPAPTPPSDAIGVVMRHLVPDAEIAFGHGVGFTDSNWFHAAYPETVAYGFDPHLVDSHDDVMRRCHGKDARIRVRDLAPQALHAERVACGSPN